MPINNDTILTLVKSYQAYKEALAKKLDLSEIRRFEEAERAKEEATKAAAAAYTPTTGR